MPSACVARSRTPTWSMPSPSKVVIEAGKKITPRLARKLAEDGVKELLVSDEHLYGQYLADELVDPKTGIIHGEAGQEIDEKLLEKLKEAGQTKLACSTSTISTPAVTSAIRWPPTRRRTTSRRCSRSTASCARASRRPRRPPRPCSRPVLR